MRNKPALPCISNSRGSALIAVIIFGVIISICAAYAYRSTLFQSRLAYRSNDYLVALNVAEAGAELAMIELNNEDTAFSGWTGSDPVLLTTNITDVDNRVVGETTVEVTDVNGSPRITATGFIPSRANPVVTRTVRLSTDNNTEPPPWGEFGLFAFGNIVFSGGMTVDSYDPENPSSPTGKAGVGSMGNISFHGSQTINGNIQAGGDLWFDNNSIKINGNAYYGNSIGYPNQWNAPQIKGETKKTSLRTPDRKPLPTKPGKPDSNNNNTIRIRPLNGGGKTQNGLSSGASLSLSNSKVTFPAPGKYYLSQISGHNNSQIEIVGTGDVTIYVDGNFNLSGISQTEIKSETGTGGPKVDIIANNFSASSYGETRVLGESNLNVYADTISAGGSNYTTIADNAKVMFSARNLNFSGGAGMNMKQPYSNNPGKPSNLVLYASEAANFTNGAKIPGVFYGPDATTNFSGGFNWWGAVIGNNINITGGPGLRIDEGLFKPSGGSGAFVTAWSEVAPVKFDH